MSEPTSGSAPEPRDTKLRRLHMRSIRRGIKEMDLILGGFSSAGGLQDMTDAQVDLYDEMLSENDHDLYQWASGQSAAPDRYADLMARIVAHNGMSKP